WSARCEDPSRPETCTTNIHSRGKGPNAHRPGPDYGWTDLTYLLNKHGVSWRYYVAEGTQPDCADGEMVCPPQAQHVGTPAIWNPLPDFVTVVQDKQLANIQTASHFFADAKAGKLPSVAWVVPDGKHSEHPPSPITE